MSIIFKCDGYDNYQKMDDYKDDEVFTLTEETTDFFKMINVIDEFCGGTSNEYL